MERCWMVKVKMTKLESARGEYPYTSGRRIATSGITGSTLEHREVASRSLRMLSEESALVNFWI